jgi:hypothetical protein
VVAREAIPPLVTHAIGRPQHEDAALLHRIPPPRALPEALGEGPQTLQETPGMEGSAPAIREARRAEGLKRRVSKERARVPRDFTETLQVLGPSRPDDDERGAPPVDPGLGGGQVSDLLTAEDSAEVADEGEDGLPVGPGAAERDGAALGVEDRETRQPRCHGVGHGAILPASAGACPTSTMGATL